MEVPESEARVAESEAHCAEEAAALRTQTAEQLGSLGAAHREANIFKKCSRAPVFLISLVRA